LNRFIIGMLALTIVIVVGCSSSADWNSNFVVWDGYVYEMSNEYVTEIEEEIGKVTKYSDKEGTYSGNFSNMYRKGTKYYAIVGVNTDEAIAVEENGVYRKAKKEGKYGKE
jgi:TRAP-type uncharacterized transport system substrate-binding protein